MIQNKLKTITCFTCFGERKRYTGTRTSLSTFLCTAQRNSNKAGNA